MKLPLVFKLKWQILYTAWKFCLQAWSIEALEGGQFDLVLMDVQMPILDGLTATRRIREMEQGSGSHIPIIAMTAHAMAGDRDRCIEAGMDGYVSKPLQTPELLKTMATYLDAR